jgi:hypothetical protein
MNQQTIAPAAKRSPLLPLAVGLLAAVAYGAGIVTTVFIANPTAGTAAGPAAAPRPAPVTTTHRVVPGPNEY